MSVSASFKTKITGVAVSVWSPDANPRGSVIWHSVEDEPAQPLSCSDDVAKWASQNVGREIIVEIKLA